MRVLALLAWLLLVTGCTQPVRVYEEGEFPSKLSAWGIVSSDGKSLSLHPDSLAYDLNTPLFTDYAHKLRTLWVPADSQATIDGETINLPVGSVISKTFYYVEEAGELVNVTQQPAHFTETGLNLEHARLIETRLMVHLPSGWVGLPYVWDENQRDATLEIAGDLLDVTLSGQAFAYAVPDFNQCQGCHVENLKTDAMSPIGLKLRHMNKPYRSIQANGNQLEAMADRAMLALNEDPAVLPRNADYLNPGLSLDHRARSYLDINCGHCHNPNGPADTSGLFLDIHEQDRIRLGICKPPIAAGQGTGGHRVNILPGDAGRSILTYRMRTTDLGAMMPELGRSLSHQEGVALITDWINRMEGGC